MVQAFETIEAGMDVCGEKVQMSYLNVDKRRIGDLEGEEFLASREQWTAFVGDPENETAARPFFQMLDALKDAAGADEISRIVLTVPTLERNMADRVREAVAVLGFPAEKVRLISRGESMIHYVLHQKRELWMNQVQSYDFDSTGLYVKKLSVRGIRLPKVVHVEEKKLADGDWVQLAETDPEELDRRFLGVLQEEMRRTVISSVYLVGSVFHKSWMKRSLPFLCERKKVFAGENIYAEGSCYGALRLFGRDTLNDYRFDCEGRTKIDIGIAVSHNGRSVSLPLTTAGTYWRKAGGEVECIFDRVNSVQFFLQDPETKFSRNVVIGMEELADRPNKTTRVRIQVDCVSDTEYLLSVTDLGFGELFPTTGLKKTRRIQIAGNHFEEEEV